MILALVGVVLNVFKRAESFVIWTFTNGYWAVYNYKIHENEQAFLFAAMGIFSIYGAIKWYLGKKYKPQRT